MTRLEKHEETRTITDCSCLLLKWTLMDDDCPSLANVLGFSSLKHRQEEHELEQFVLA